jgi:hypothetical protein
VSFGTNRRVFACEDSVVRVSPPGFEADVAPFMATDTFASLVNTANSTSALFREKLTCDVIAPDKLVNWPLALWTSL